MANYYATARSNCFQVKDPAMLKDALADLDVEVVTDDPVDPRRVVLLCRADGGWPGWRYDEGKAEDIEIEVPALVAPHLTDGQVAVFLEAGGEKLRCVAGTACAVNNKGGRVEVSLEDIYDLAKHLGDQMDRI
jgi:hypothetical protein